MKKRIFIGIPLTKGLYPKISHLEKEIDPKIKINWLPLKNLHLTILFLGYLEEEEVFKLLSELDQKIIQEKNLFKLLNLKIKKIDYGPPLHKRMIWLYIEKNQRLEEIKNFFEKVLEDLGIHFKKEERDFLPHINLARLKNKNRDKLPKIEKELNWSVILTQINIYESYLEKPFARYEILKSYRLFS